MYPKNLWKACAVEILPKGQGFSHQLSKHLSTPQKIEQRTQHPGCPSFWFQISNPGENVTWPFEAVFATKRKRLPGILPYVISSSAIKPYSDICPFITKHFESSCEDSTILKSEFFRCLCDGGSLFILMNSPLYRTLWGHGPYSQSSKLSIAVAPS